MLRLLIVLLFFTYCNSTSQEVSQDNKKTKVFLLAGQSNMDGRAKASGLSLIDKERLKKAQKNVTLYYNFGEGKPLDTTKVADHTARKFGAAYLFGPELFFGIKMSEKYPDHKIVLIKRAKGGMSLYGAWNSDWNKEKATLMGEQNKPKLYGEFIKYSKNVLSNISNYEICGMLWVQGETDSGKRFGPIPAKEYEYNLKKLISSVRQEFNQNNLPFLIFQVGNGDVVTGMKNIAKQDSKVVLIPQEGNKNSKFYFERNPPPIGHYVTESMKRIGEYFFAYYEENFSN